MYHRATVVALALCVVSQLGVVGADAQSKGAAGPKLTAALKATAAGQCPEEIMAPLLLDACEQQLSVNRRMLSELGELLTTTYRGVEEMPNGIKAEAYRVEFAKGRMMWVASLDSLGRLSILWSNLSVQPK
jgi:hypothetical protein